MLENIFTSVNECSTEIEAKVTGSIPKWLKGNLVRLGPGKWDLKDDFVLNHWLDGCGFLINFRFDDGHVFFSSKFLRSDAYKKMMTVHKPVFTEFGTRAYPDPNKGMFSRMLSSVVPSDLTDNDISNIYKINEDIFVATESCNIWRIDPKSLDSKEKLNLDKMIGTNIMSSHPQYSPQDNCYYNIGTNFISGLKYSIVKIPALPKKQDSNNDKSKSFSKASIITTISSNWKTGFSYCHSFAISENYIILIEQPLVVNAFKLAVCTFKGKSLEECLEWRPEESARFHVIDKKTGKELKTIYEAAAFFFFHTINAYEENGYLIIDLVAYEDVTVLEKYHIKRLRRNEFQEECPPMARRYVLPLENQLSKQESGNLVDLPGCIAKAEKNDKAIWLTFEQLSPPGFELPTLNCKKYSGKKYRYVYGSGTFEKGFFANSASKLDLENKSLKLWKDTDTVFPGEPVFVPDPNSSGEDDGILLIVVLESDPNKPHYLTILNATSMQEIGRADIPKSEAQIPPTIHGLFLPTM